MTATAIPFNLVDAKLAEPITRPGTVAKSDLIARLCAATEPATTVIAPAGYGKSTLLAQWAEADSRPFAWFALDGRDDDPVVFLRYIAGAIHRVEPLPSEVFDSLSGPRAYAWPERVPRLGRALASFEHPFVLVLDDLHAIANPSCLDVLAGLFEYVSAGSQIAVASREEPALPLARWRAQGRLHEVGVEDLRLDDLEAGPASRSRGNRTGGERVVRAHRADGGLARRLVPCRALTAGRIAEGWRGSPPTTGSCPSTSGWSSSPASRRPSRSSSSTPRCWTE